MALVWVEGFDCYGGGMSTTPATMGQMGYSNIKGVLTNGRTGTYGFNFNWNFGGQAGFLTRPLLTTTNKLGQGAAMAPVGGQMNANNANGGGCIWQSAGGVTEMNVSAMGDGSIAVFDRSGINKGQTAPNMLIPDSYQWVEAVAIQNTGGAGTGYAEVRVNGIQRLVINNINLPNLFAFHGIGGAGAGNQNFIFDDWITWDGSGANNNTFMSDRRLVLCVPNANGAIQNFTITGAQPTAWQSCNAIPPVDTNFITGNAAGDISEFAKQNVTINSTDIAAVVVLGRIFKSDAGTASGRIGINSAANVLNSPTINPGTVPAWYQFVVEKDPNGNVPWTRTNVNNANIRITRDT